LLNVHDSGITESIYGEASPENDVITIQNKGSNQMIESIVRIVYTAALPNALFVL
jgi:hypothetical protein